MSDDAQNFYLSAVLNYCRDGAGATDRGKNTLVNLLDAAAGLAIEEGYDALTLRSIARRAELGLRTVQHYFASKDKLLAALFEFKDAQFELQYQATLREKSSSPLKTFEKVLDLLIADNLSEDARLRFSSSIYHHAQENQPFFMEMLQTLYLRHWARLESCLRRIHPNAKQADIDRHALLIMTLLEGIVGVAYAYQGDSKAMNKQLATPVRKTILDWAKHLNA